MGTINHIKGIFEDTITADIHNAFTRYSLGEFEKENFIIKQTSKNATIYTGFEYLNFIHRFLAQTLKGDVQIDGFIESVRDQSKDLQKLDVAFEEKRRFGKSGTKYIIIKQTVPVATYKQLVEDLFTEFLLLKIKTPQVELKVKGKTTPKLGAPTEKFVTLKMDKDILAPFLDTFLFDVKEREFKEAIINHTYLIEDIKVDEKLLETDALRARKEAKRKGLIKRKVTINGAVVKESEKKFLV